jgi:eukaryotic-like serine/threonine-protein kinase
MADVPPQTGQQPLPAAVQRIVNSRRSILISILRQRFTQAPAVAPLRTLEVLFSLLLAGTLRLTSVRRVRARLARPQSSTRECTNPAPEVLNCPVNKNQPLSTPLMSLETEKILRFENCTLDASRRTLSCAGEPVALKPKTFELLLLLAGHAGQVMTKEELIERLWPDSFVEERNLTQHVFLLRKAFTEHGLDERLIVTVSGRGYRFSARVEELAGEDLSRGAARVSELVVHAVESTTTVVVEESSGAALTARLRARRFWFAVAGMLILAACAFGYYWLHRPQPVLRKVVIADFLNLTGDPAFDRSLPTALGFGLGQSPYLQVMGTGEEHSALAAMQKPPDTPLLGDTAVELCRRNDYQALLQGKIETAGVRYHLSMDVIGCVSGKSLDVFRAEAANKDVVLDTLDTLAARVRRNLGESNQSIEQFETPMREATTFSFEALKAYDTGSDLGNANKYQASIPYFEKAVELDPKFAEAEASLGTAYYDMGALDKATGYYRKAFDLSSNLSSLERIYIQSNYFIMAERDLPAGRQAFEEWTRLYPAQESAWIDLAVVNMQLGDFPAAIEASEHSVRYVEVRPPLAYANLAQAYMRANRFADAKRTVAEAQALGKDSVLAHHLLLQMAMIDNDRGALQREIAWNQSNPQLYWSLETQAIYEAAQGRYRRSEEVFQSAIADAQKNAGAEVADNLREVEAEVEIELGRTAKTVELLRQIKDHDDFDFAIDLARTGDVSSAQAILRKPEQFPHGTFEHNVYLPEIKSLLALHRGDAAGAVAALDASIPYQLAISEATELRAEALLAARQGAKAQEEFQKLIDHPALDDAPYPRNTLAHLGLARAYALEGNTAASRNEYQKFFSLWKDADPDDPVLLQARLELARLPQRQ